jgi:hypothetical protein
LAGLVAAFCIFGQTMLFLVDASGLLGENPEYTETSAGRAQDLANYYVAYFETSTRSCGTSQFATRSARSGFWP